MSAVSGSVPWFWQEIDAGFTAVSGDFSKEFKNETVKEPGIFAADHISAEAVLLVRETIQNSWDAARERYEASEAEDFAVRFRLYDLEGSDRQRIVEELGLGDLARRVAGVRAEHGAGGRRMLGLSERDCLSRLNEARTLRLLEVSEEHGGGMGGPWQGDHSKLFKAMCSLGITPSTSGRGGSYGYGKAGLIRGSAIRTVVAYTCFPEHPDDPGVTRRLLGMTYWGSHQLQGSSFNGTRWFSDRTVDGKGVPYSNEQADQVAQKIGISLRSASEPAELGTTLLVIEPTVNADGLLRATERFWWPALCDDELAFEVSVTDETVDGHERHPRPKQNPDLKAFLDTFDNALTPPDSKRDRYREHRLGAIEGVRHPGTVALVSDPDGWSFPTVGASWGPNTAEGDADSVGDTHDVGSSSIDDLTNPEAEHRSLVALVRGPRMVVEYLEAARAAPHIRGTFVASADSDDMLRDTEPKAHDAWHTDAGSGDVPPDSAALAKTLLRRITNHVNRFRKDIKPKPKPNRDLKLPVWDELARQLEGSVRGSGPPPPPPPPPPRLLSIHPGERLEPASNGGVRLTGRASVSFSEHHTPTVPEGDLIEVRVRYQFEGADRKEAADVALLVTGPEEFEEVDGRVGTYRGRLRAHETAKFGYESDPYNPEWSGALSVEAELVPVQTTPSSDDGMSDSQ
ncbi:hypothetical protein [Candidatus Poriferisodalis sp.]|uniref:hypothetical protein n=1 Tax=Candidatus Poriferisodalis sp. TaxID=3101277 RepID=UPI003B029200